MKKVSVEEAVGQPLCHDITAMVPGFKGALFHRGQVITEEDVETLLNIGKKHIFVGEPEPGMLHEEDCARRLAAMISEGLTVEVSNQAAPDGLPSGGVHFEGPSEGKILMISDRKGMLRVDTGLLNEVNSIGDITIATLPDHYRVEAGDRLASMRIVPLFTEEKQIRKAEELCREKALIDLLPYRERKVGVIVTGSEIFSGRTKDRFEPVVRKKLAYYPGEILEVKICDDDRGMILDAARELMDRGADFLIFTGGMSVDPDDLTPGAIKELGAEIIRYGVPAQPGNMTLVAYLDNSKPAGSPRSSGGSSADEIPILGVPGAAIHLPTTIFDVLLPQIYTGLRLTGEDLRRLADGGLCQLCEACHYPNCTFGRY
ncbi:MAG: molybdopterin-binding protein [Eubacterium sp.]|nr:molybdopterin-binding protein [Eubacterium sp.]